MLRTETAPLIGIRTTSTESSYVDTGKKRETAKEKIIR